MLVIPVSVTQVLTSCAGDLDYVFSHPKAMPDVFSPIFLCRWHVYIFLRDAQFVGVLDDRGDVCTHRRESIVRGLAQMEWMSIIGSSPGDYWTWSETE